MTQTTICLIVFAFTVVMYLINKLPLALTSMISMLLLVITGSISATSALSGFANSTTIIMVSMFVVGAGLNRTQMVHKISDLVYKVSGGSFTKGLMGYCLVTIAIAQVMPSAILIYSIAYPLAADFCRKMGVSPSKAMFSIGLMSIVWVGALPIGAGATAYIQYNTIMATYGVTNYKFQMFDLFIARLPYAIALFFFAVFLAPKFAPDHKLEEFFGGKGKEKVIPPPLSPLREAIGYGVFILVVIGLLLTNFVKIEAWQICFAGALTLVLTGVLTEREAIEAMNIPPALLFIGALAMGNALVGTGAGNMISGLVTTLLGGHPSGYLVGFVFFMTVFIMTQVMSNLAVFSAAQPIVILTCKALGYSPIGPLALCFIAAWTSYMTPMATICVPVMMTTGGYTQRDLFKMGWLPALISVAIAVPWVMTIFPV